MITIELTPLSNKLFTPRITAPLNSSVRSGPNALIVNNTSNALRHHGYLIKASGGKNTGPCGKRFDASAEVAFSKSSY